MATSCLINPARMNFRCARCGRESLSFRPRCGGCGAWNSLSRRRHRKAIQSAPQPEHVTLGALAGVERKRLVSGCEPWDRVLYGGLVYAQSVVLVGKPGVGKSTLALQLSELYLAQVPVLYASAEEIGEQVAERAARIGVDVSRIAFLGSLDVNDLEASIADIRPGIVFIDSVQYVDDRRGHGTTLQRRFEALERLLRIARKYGTAVVMLSQVNGKGDVNGGERVKHVPDAVVDIESSDGSDKVTLRVDEKNRFGPKGLSAAMRMTGKGFRWIANA